jgi:heat shock protein HslJ
MRYRLAGLALLLVCLFTVSACTNPFTSIMGGTSASSIAPRPTTVLSGTSWTLKRLIADGKNWDLAPTAPVTLQFQQHDASYLGSSGCNYYDGAYALSGHQLHLHFTSVTQRACIGLIMSQEVAYLNEMQQVQSYQMDGKMLALKDGSNNIVLVFAAA